MWDTATNMRCQYYSEQVYFSNKRFVGGTLFKEPHESSYDPLITVGFCKKIYIFIMVGLSANSFYNALQNKTLLHKS